MSFTCSICGVALDLTPGSFPLLGEDEGQKRYRWIQQAGQHMAAVHTDIMTGALLLQGQIGFLRLMSAVQTDDKPIVQKFNSDRAAILQSVKALQIPQPTQEATVS